MSGGSAQTIRRHSVELCQDLVLHGIGKSTFQIFAGKLPFQCTWGRVKSYHTGGFGRPRVVPRRTRTVPHRRSHTKTPAKSYQVARGPACRSRARRGKLFFGDRNCFFPKQCLHLRGSYFFCIVIALKFAKAGCQPSCLDLPRLA